jgi:hypothetical protein
MAATTGTYRVLCQVRSDLSTTAYPKWKLDTFADHSHPIDALELVRRWQGAHIDAIEHQRARVFVQLIGGETG